MLRRPAALVAGIRGRVLEHRRQNMSSSWLGSSNSTSLIRTVVLCHDQSVWTAVTSRSETG